MPVLIPVAVAYGVGVLAGSALIGSLAGLAASAVISGLEQRRAQRRARAEYNASLRDQTVMVKGGVHPRNIVYGRTALSGPIIFAESFGSLKEHLVMVIALAHGEVDAIETVYFNDVPLDIDPVSGHLVLTAPYALTQGTSHIQQATVPGSPYQVALNGTPVGGWLQIQDISNGTGSGDGGSPPMLQAGTDYTLSGSTVTFAAGLSGHIVQMSYASESSASWVSVWRFTGAAGQDLSSLMLSLLGGVPSWTSAHKCQGMACLVVKMTFQENIYPSGIPNIKAVVRGRKVLDSRSSTTAFTRNAALCARDYITLAYGLAASGAKLDDTGATNPSANICDEDVQLTATPTYQDRYTADGVINTGDDRLSNLGLFAQAMAGSINYSQGKWRIRAGAYTAPALTLDESKLSDAGGITIVPYASRRDLINGAKGVFINADKGYIEDTFPEWTSSTYVTQDGGAALTTSISMPLVTDPVRAQRLAKIAVTRAREQLTLACHCNLSTYAWQVGDMVTVNLARYGFSGKAFRIIQRGFSGEGGMRFLLREEPNGLYDWNLGEAVALPGAANTTLPNPAVVGVPTITGIQSGANFLYKAGDGTMVARIKVSVMPPDDQYVLVGGRLELQYKRGDWTATDWVKIFTDGNATAIWIDPAFDAQNYLIRVRAVNSAGYASDWTPAMSHACVGRLGAIENLLLNSDFTEELGYGSGVHFLRDPKVLRHWSGAWTANATQYVGRNYDAGRTWNIGPGGAYIVETPAAAVNEYGYIYQTFPAEAGVEYEGSAYAAAHRCQLYLFFQALDVNGAHIAYSSLDAIDAATGVLGSITELQNRPRLWFKYTAPTGTKYLRLYLQKQWTTPGQSTSYAFWHRAMANVAPSGVTRATATPWVPSNTNTVDGQLVALGSAVRTTGVTVFSESTFFQFNFTPVTKGLVTATLTGLWNGIKAGSPTFIGRPRVWLRITQGGATLAETAKESAVQWDTIVLAYFNSTTHRLSASVATGTQVEVRCMLDPDPADVPSGNGYTCFTTNMKIDAVFDRKD